MQGMLLQLQKYNLQVKYKRGDKNFLADMAHPSEIHSCELSSNLEDIDHTLLVTVTYKTLDRPPSMTQF